MKRSILIAVTVIVTLTASASQAQISKFYVWKKLAPCQDTRQDWYTVSDSVPGGGGSLQSWIQVEGPFDSFAGAMGVADDLKQSDKFIDACCRDWGVFRNIATGVRSAARTAQFLPPELQMERGGLCCETAFWDAGLPVSPVRDCRNLQLSDRTSITVQRNMRDWVTTIGSVPVPPPFTTPAPPPPPTPRPPSTPAPPRIPPGPDPATIARWNGTWYAGGGCEYVMNLSVSGAAFTASTTYNGNFSETSTMSGTWYGGGFNGTYSGSYNNPGCQSCKATSGARRGTVRMTIDTEGRLYMSTQEAEDAPVFPGRGFTSTWYKQGCK